MTMRSTPRPARSCPLKRTTDEACHGDHTKSPQKPSALFTLLLIPVMILVASSGMNTERKRNYL